MTTTDTSTTATSPAMMSEPTSIGQLGLDRGILRDLALKMLFYRGRLSRSELAAELRLSSSVLEDVVQTLAEEGLSAVLASTVGGPGSYAYTLTQKGLNRAEEALARSGYVGPAPVPLADYIAQQRLQSVVDTPITRDEVEDALGGLVLSEQTVTRIGRAAASRKPTLVHGQSGNGKTTAVRTIGHVVGGTIRIPYAIEAAGHIIHLYDPSKHQLVGNGANGNGELLRARVDGRWAEIVRPVIWTGGELTRHSLELMYDDETKVYEAPLQLKANGGALIVDDFGRQQIPAVQLLNRWIVALEGGVDHLTMHTGQTIEVPFDVMVLFSTNLPPERLADEAFLRRIRYKIEVPNPTEAEYRAIFRRECQKQSLPYDDAVVTHLMSAWYAPYGRELRGCHPRDIVEAVVDASRYEGRAADMSPESIDEACATYFLTPLNAP